MFIYLERPATAHKRCRRDVHAGCPPAPLQVFDCRCIAFLMSTQSHLTSRILRPHTSAVAENVNAGDVPQRRGGRGVALRLCHMVCVSTLSELFLSHLEDPAGAHERRRRDVQPRNVLQRRGGGSVIGRQVLQQLAVAAAAVHQGFDAAGDEQRSDERVALRCCRRRKQPNCSDKDLKAISSPLRSTKVLAPPKTSSEAMSAYLCVDAGGKKSPTAPKRQL